MKKSAPEGAAVMLRATATPSRTAAASTDGESSALAASEYVDILAKRVAFSRTNALLCGTLIAAGVAEVLWIVLLAVTGRPGQLPDHWLFVLIETYVTLGLLAEIALRLALERSAFFRQLSNIFDISVALLSVLASTLYAIGRETPVEMAISELIVTLRVVFRLFRLLSVTKGFKRHHQAADRKLEIEIRPFDDDDDANVPLTDTAASPPSPGEDVV